MRATVSARRTYFVKRVGWKWEVWHRPADGPNDPIHVSEWRSNNTRYWWRMNAEREAQSLLIAYSDGMWVAVGVLAPDAPFTTYTHVLATKS